MSAMEREESPLSDCPSIGQEREDGTNMSKEKPKRDSTSKRATRKKRTATVEWEGEASDADENVDSEAKPKAKRTRTRKRKVDAEEIGEEDALEKKRRRRRKIPENERTYEIAPIAEVLPTSFKGRLGYACLNTILRASWPDPIFCSRTCRLATLTTLGPEHLRSLALQNVRDLLTIIEWNATHDIFLFRISSELFPFASHPVHGYTLEFADAELKKAGDRAKELGMRLTSHPGQFTQLGSPREVVVKNAVRDLEYHCEMMDRMGLGVDSVMIIHMGGTFGDKPATLARFRQNYTTLLSPAIKARLVLENDELCYNVDDLLPISRELNIPIVFDYHHDWLNPSFRDSGRQEVSDKNGGETKGETDDEEKKREIKTPQELIPSINAVWEAKGIKPKQHWSEPRRGAVSIMEKRAHSDRVGKLPDGLPDDMDLMLECKDKEQAVFYIYRLYNLKEVEHKILRPPVEEESLRTGGRKSSKRKKTSKKDEDEEDEIKADAEDGVVGDAEEAEDDEFIASKSKSKRKASTRPTASRRTRSIHARKGQASASDEKLPHGAEQEIGREAEEHGLSLEDAGEALEIEGMDCGSGDAEGGLGRDVGGDSDGLAKSSVSKQTNKRRAGTSRANGI